MARRKVKVAIVGSGLAGLTAAYLLANVDQDEVEFEVHVFEKASTLGMDSSSVSLPTQGTGEWRIDVPMRSFQGGYYPQLIALYKRLGVVFRPADFSYSFSSLSRARTHKFTHTAPTNAFSLTTTMLYNGASGREGLSMPSSMRNWHAQYKEQHTAVRAAVGAYTYPMFVLQTMQIAICYLWMLLCTVPVFRFRGSAGGEDTMTFKQWAEWRAPKNMVARWAGIDLVWGAYFRRVLVPLFSAVCTAPEQDVLEHPVEEFLDYIWMTLGTHHYVVVNNIKDVVSRLTSCLRHDLIHLASPILAVTTNPYDNSMISIQCANKVHNGFHHVIFATQANRAASLLETYVESLPLDSDPARRQRSIVEKQVRCLKTFVYRLSIVVNHTDDAFIPKDPRDRRDLNLVQCFEADSEKQKQKQTEEGGLTVSTLYTMATHILRPPPGDLCRPISSSVYQTTNPIVAPRVESVLSVARLERAVLSVEGKKAVKGLYKESQTSTKWWGKTKAEVPSGLGPLQGGGKLDDCGPGIWICGSYACGGIPLLEGCVVSARNVVEQGIMKSEGISVRGSPW